MSSEEDTLGRRLQAQRQVLGLTQAKAAKAARVAGGLIFMLETKSGRVSAPVLRRVARALGLAPEPLEQQAEAEGRLWRRGGRGGEKVRSDQAPAPRRFELGALNDLEPTTAGGPTALDAELEEWSLLTDFRPPCLKGSGAAARVRFWRRRVRAAEDSRCPGEKCPLCSGEACDLCGVGLRTKHPSLVCEHGVDERHRPPNAPVDLEIVDRDLCEILGTTPHPRQFAAGWFDVIGYQIALGRQLGGVELRAAVLERARTDERGADLKRALAYLEAGYRTTPPEIQEDL